MPWLCAFPRNSPQGCDLHLATPLTGHEVLLLLTLIPESSQITRNQGLIPECMLNGAELGQVAPNMQH